MGNKPLQALVDRGYALNYELLKKTVLKLEGKLLDSEKTMFGQGRKIEELSLDITKQKKMLKDRENRIKELVLVEGGNPGFSTNTSCVKAGMQSPSIDRSLIAKMEGYNTSPGKSYRGQPMNQNSSL